MENMYRLLGFHFATLGGHTNIEIHWWLQALPAQPGKLAQKRVIDFLKSYTNGIKIIRLDVCIILVCI